MRKFLSVLLIIVIVGLLAFVWWRWLELRPKHLDVISISDYAPSISHPLDNLLSKYINTIANSPQLIAQFMRKEQNVNYGGFAIGRCEVNQKDFRQFASWRALNIDTTNETKLYKPHPKRPQKWTYSSQTEKHKILGQLSTPLGGVSFFDAWQYCADGGGRLPSADEFEAISGGSSRLYPWGNEFNADPWQYQDPVLNIASKCNAYANTASINGIYDLGSNVSEWAEDNEYAVLVGGNAYNRPYKLHTLNLIRRRAAFDFRSQYTGFRCIYPNTSATKTTITLPWGATHSLQFIAKTRANIGVATSAKIPALLDYLNQDQLKSLSALALSDKKHSLKIMRYEVSVALYEQFLADPLVRLGFYNHNKQPNNISHKPKDWQQQKTSTGKPITNISWWSAWSFANWLGGRLPSAAEWEALATARLTLFPYGNSYQAFKTPHHQGSNSQLDNAIDSSDDSKHHIRGLSGNASEWTNTSVLTGSGFAVVIKGGSYLMPTQSARNDQISQAPPAYTSSDLGFRVVFDAKDR